MQLLDNTRLSDFKRCPRYFYYRHIRDWVPEGKRPELAFGLAWHSAMDTLWPMATEEAQNLGNSSTRGGIVDAAYDAFLEKWEAEGFERPEDMDAERQKKLEPRTPLIAKEMLYEYLDARTFLFRNPDFSLLAVEKPFAVPLDPDNADIFYVGRLDKVFSLRDDIYIGEHKTTTAYSVAEGFRSAFTESFSPNSQIDGYAYAGHMEYGERLRAIWVDAALVHKKEHGVFKLIPIDRHLGQLDSWLSEAHYWRDSLNRERSVLDAGDWRGDPYLTPFPKNTCSCSMYAGCTYLPLCKGFANPHAVAEAPAGYREEHWSPVKEVKLQELGLADDQ